MKSESDMSLSKSTLLVMASRLLVLFAGLIISVVAAQSLSSVEQGYFFTFISIAAAQTLFELGITNLVLHYLSHARIGILQAQGFEQKRVAKDLAESTRAYTARYFGRAAILFTLFVGAAGALFFALSNSAQGVQWQMPWAMMVVGTALSLFNLSYYLYLEAFGHLNISYRVRIASTTILIFTFISAAYSLGGLLSYPLALLASNCYAFIVLRRAYTNVNIEYELNGEYTPKNLEIGREQRKMAVSAVAGYITANSITPYSFHYFGAEIAGQVGLTMSIFAAIATIAMARTTAEAPTYGPLISAGKLMLLKRRYIYTLMFCVSLAIVMCAGAIAARQVGLAFAPEYSNRVLGLVGFSVVGLLIVANVSLSVTSTVLRSFKSELLMWPSLSAAAIVMIGQLLLRLDPVNCLALLTAFNFLIFFPFAQLRLNFKMANKNA